MLAQLRQCSRTQPQHNREQIYESSSWFTSSSETNNKCSAETAHILAQRHGVLFKVLRRTYIRRIADSPNHQAWCGRVAGKRLWGGISSSKSIVEGVRD